MIPHIIKTSSISLFPPNVAPILIDSSHVNFTAVRDALSVHDYDVAVMLASVPAFVQKAVGPDVTVNDQGVFWKGTPISSYLADKMMQFFREGLPFEHYGLFLSNLMNNPSRTSVQELFLFLEAADLPITEDGCFLAYKAVRSNFRDKHTGRFDNSPGTSVPRMERNQVDDNRERTCSYGYHAAAYTYASGFMSGSDKLVAVKINPADVVSIPSDYGNQKLRCTYYEVLFEVPGAADVFKDRAYVSGSADGDNFYNDDEDDADIFWTSGLRD
jgi:hypothetical protein